MRASELRDMSIEELEVQLTALIKERFNNRIQHSTQQMSQTHLLKETSKNIARVKTVLREKKESAE